MSTALDKALHRLQEKYPPKHPDRSTMRSYEREQTNVQPIVHDSNGWSPQTNTTVERFTDWGKQDRIRVGVLDMSLWCDPPKRGLSGRVKAGKGRGNKGPKNSGK